MNVKVGDILCAKEKMIINVEPHDGDETVDKGDYFAVVKFGSFEHDGETLVGWTLLSQKTASLSKWDKNICSPMSNHFVKV